MKTVYFAGGCFWGTQKFFDQFDGVLETEVGYANGTTERPSYEDVCYRDTGHAETVKVIYDEEQLSLKQLLRYYFMTIDPTSLNRQGNDRGTQYRTGIYYEAGDPEKATLLKDIGDILEEVKQRYFEPLVVEVLPLDNFYTAENYHQKYLDKHPFGYCHIPRALLHLDA
ncbi:MAG: peptide-methionine (S)-S-oxide reductase MsrA [Clostridia bacterium]|nr:peptide-methionine (S)-S-oxide reductase MsrA [Clostridia bacterium]MBR1704741.1 peptide-methionine (S)-S-oxide reductase MsrA [Clostridia bacterium]